MEVKEIIDKYLARGFGSMNKNDFEVWIFHYLMEHGQNVKSNYEASIFLKIPEAKVKRLRYEADLRYGSHGEKWWYSELNAKLKKARLKKAGECVQFSIEEVSLRKFIDAKLKADGRFSDSSFNSEVVTLSVEDLEYLYKQNESEDLKNLLKEAKKKLGKDGITLAKVFKWIAKNYGKDIVDVSLGGLSNLVSGIAAIL